MDSPVDRNDRELGFCNGRVWRSGLALERITARADVLKENPQPDACAVLPIDHGFPGNLSDDQLDANAARE
jgi:hypothetical protein